jgi:hypothetical protein
MAKAGAISKAKRKNKVFIFIAMYGFPIFERKDNVFNTESQHFRD